MQVVNARQMNNRDVAVAIDAEFKFLLALPLLCSNRTDDLAAHLSWEQPMLTLG